MLTLRITHYNRIHDESPPYRTPKSQESLQHLQVHLADDYP